MLTLTEDASFNDSQSVLNSPFIRNSSQYFHQHLDIFRSILRNACEGQAAENKLSHKPRQCQVAQQSQRHRNHRSFSEQKHHFQL
jgi:hypothetical protein